MSDIIIQDKYEIDIEVGGVKYKFKDPIELAKHFVKIHHEYHGLRLAVDRIAGTLNSLTPHEVTPTNVRNLAAALRAELA
jgi:hypothetical protein